MLFATVCHWRYFATTAYFVLKQTYLFLFHLLFFSVGVFLEFDKQNGEF